MLHKTVDESDTQSISTKLPQSKAASFLSTSKRNMFRSKTLKNQKKVQMQINNVINLQPQFSCYVISDQVYFLESSQNFVINSDLHYVLNNQRSKPIMIPRNSQPLAQLMYTNARKPGITTQLQSLQRFSNLQYPSMLHINITKYNPKQSENQAIQARDVYVQNSGCLQPIYFTTVENSKKAVLIFQVEMDGKVEEREGEETERKSLLKTRTNLNSGNKKAKTNEKQYQFWLINIMKNNKIKNPNHSSMYKQNALSFSDQTPTPPSSTSPSNQKQFLYNPIQSLKQKIKLRADQYIIKVINSQYGDSIQVATNFQIYELEFQPNAIYLKKIDVIAKIGRYMNTNGNGNGNGEAKQDKYQDQLIDVCYIIDGLKMFFITKNCLFGIIQAQNIIYMKSMYQIIGISPPQTSSSTTNNQNSQQKSDPHKKQQQILHPKQLHALMDKLIIQCQRGIVYLVKLGERQVSFQRKIQLPVNNGGGNNVITGNSNAKDTNTNINSSQSTANNTISYKIKVLPRHDQLILQRIYKKNGKLELQLLSKNLLSPKNQFMKFYSSLMLSSKQGTGKSSTNLSNNNNVPLKIVNSKSNSISCILRQNTITFYRFNQNFSSQTKPIELLFSKTFFQKPLYISIDPYSSNFLILFKQFVKFFKFQYNDISQFYTYNVRGVNYASYSESGQYILIVSDDKLYCINSFSFVTEKVIQAYGDVKSVRFYDSIIYILLKNKVNKNVSETLTMQIYVWQNQQYNNIKQIKIQPNQALMTDRKFAIIASNKQINVYRLKPEIYEQQQPNKNKNNILMSNSTLMLKSQIELHKTRKIKLSESTQYPTCVTLCEQFGIVLIGTNYGRVYEYLWPFVSMNDNMANFGNMQNQLQAFYRVNCSTSQITKIHISTTFEHVYIYSKNMNILQMNIIQYVEGEQMPNIYIINPKTLYDSQSLKYQFTNREYLYQKYTAYIYEDIRQTNQVIQQLRFILEKTNDDIEQYVSKTTEKHEGELSSINLQKKNDTKAGKNELELVSKNHSQENSELKQRLKQEYNLYIEKKKKDKEQYQEKLLKLYQQASRLRGIINQLNKQQTREKDVYLIQNQQAKKRLVEESLVVEEQYKKKFQEIQLNSFSFQKIQKQEAFKKIDQQLKQYRQAVRDSVNQQLQLEQQRKQTLLGSNGYLYKQIINYKQRKDQFESLIMQTNLQIDQLYSDQSQYSSKKNYLITQLSKKQKIIEQKQRQLIKIVDNAELMKKLKETHQFQLKQYQVQFEPVNSKINVIDRNIQKMNGEILREYLNKVQKQNSIIDNKQKLQKLKKAKKDKIRNKLSTENKIVRLLAQLQFLLQDPLNQNLKSNMIRLSNGDKLLIDEQQIKQRIQNAKIIRKKQFIGKQIEQSQKRQQMMMKNKNQITRHYNQNTMLVRQFNNLKQLNRKFQAMVKQAQNKLIAAKAGTGLRVQTPRKKIHSMVQLKKFSQKKLTPFQKHQQQFYQVYKGQSTTQTKLSRSNQRVESLSLLKTLIKDIDGPQPKYQKMQIIRNKIKSFVNPEIRIRKTLITQRPLFQKKIQDQQIRE